MPALLLAGALPAMAAETTDRMTGCRLEVPADWQGGTVQWTGECPGQRAEGLGVLRLYDGGQVRTAFYGEMARGQPRFGVIDLGGGYVAGRFVDGVAAPTDDRSLILRAFRVASDAARAASERFRAQGNLASARHYAAMAERLATQMD